MSKLPLNQRQKMLNLDYLAKVGRSKKVSVLMMMDRGYQIPEEEKFEDNDLGIGAKYLQLAKQSHTSLGNALSSVYYGDNKPTTLIMFFNNNYDESKKRNKMVSSEQAKNAISLWLEKYSECKECILIAPGKLSPEAKKEVIMDNLTVLTHEFLTFPIARHDLVPQHIALTDKEKQEFTSARNIQCELLPQLKIHDPISLYYGYKIGTVVRISRPGWTVFRVVSN